MNKINSNFEGPAIFVGMDVHKFSWNLGIHLDEMFMKNVHQKLIPPLWPIIVLQKWLVPIAEVKNTKRKPEMYNPLQYPCCKKETMLTLLRCNRLRCNRRGPPVDWEDITVSQLSIILETGSNSIYETGKNNNFGSARTMQWRHYVQSC